MRGSIITALLLEDGAEIFAKPELMIYADDVQCAHGNTAGGLDERALFYMRARGLPEAEARALLIEASWCEAIPDGLPEALDEELVGAFALAGGGAADVEMPLGVLAGVGAAGRSAAVADRAEGAA